MQILSKTGSKYGDLGGTYTHPKHTSVPPSPPSPGFQHDPLGHGLPYGAWPYHGQILETRASFKRELSLKNISIKKISKMDMFFGEEGLLVSLHLQGSTVKYYGSVHTIKFSQAHGSWFSKMVGHKVGHGLPQSSSGPLSALRDSEIARGPELDQACLGYSLDSVSHIYLREDPGQCLGGTHIKVTR